MNRRRLAGPVLAGLAVVLLLSGGALAQGGSGPSKAELGKPAPDFTLKDLLGKDVALSKFKGKIVVLEWYNPACPSVETAHGAKGTLRKLPSKHMKKNKVVWLAVNSSAPGKEGSGLKDNRKYAKKYRIRYPVLLDEDGKVGHLYAATKTPEFFVIDKEGKLVYRGAEDNAADVEKGTADAPVNYVDAVIGALVKGEKVPYDKTVPCG